MTCVISYNSYFGHIFDVDIHNDEYENLNDRYCIYVDFWAFVESLSGFLVFTYQHRKICPELKKMKNRKINRRII